jgi:2OG-Fe(II) oxygenase superfamily
MAPPPVAPAEILNLHLQSDKEALAREFREADPFPHVVIPDFFSREVAQRLLDDFPSFEERFARGEMGDVGRKAAREDVRDISDAYRELDDFLQTPEFLNLISEVTGIPGLLYDSEYHGGGTHENGDGASLYTHVDFNYHPKGWHRRLNLIVYLSPEWEEEWGGSLELHSNPWDPSNDYAKRVPTNFNQAVLFETSERSWHGFRPIKLPEDRRHLSRKSLAIYLYTKDRPAEETAALHSTIYVPFGMPDDLEPGSVLTDEQYQLLNARFNEYRSMLKFQYDRQLRLSEEFGAKPAYSECISRIRETVRRVLPRDATVIVVTKGDAALLDLYGRRAWHFPQDEDGAYAWSYPEDGASVIDQLEALRVRGGQYLLFPAPALWWLESYPEFAAHLRRRYPVILRDERTCAIFALEENHRGQGNA